MSQVVATTTDLRAGDRVICTQGENKGTVGVIDRVLSDATGWGKMTPQQFPLVRVYVPERDCPAWQFSHWAHAFELVRTRQMRPSRRRTNGTALRRRFRGAHVS
jgi:hypothetical protein